MPILRENELDIISLSEEQTRRLGTRLGKLLQPGDVICLTGDLGAGKTVFSAGIGRGWGATTPLTSPTYNLVHEHTRDEDDTILYHLDCYRLNGAEDVESIGFDDMLDRKAVMVIEWAERIQEALPKQCLWIEISVLEEPRRNFVIEATGKRYKVLTEKFREESFGF